MKQHWDTIILGATFYGCGLAAGKKDVLILEPSILAGSDFTLHFDPGTEWQSPPHHPDAVEFYEDLVRRGALRNGRLHMGALAPVFSRWCLERGLRIALWHEILDVSENEVTAFTVEGEKRFTADHIIDARPVAKEFLYVTASLFLEKELPDGPGGNFEIVGGCLRGEAYLLKKLPGPVSWPDARREIHEAWMARNPAIQGRLLTVGARFSYRNHPNPAAALDLGLSQGGRHV